MTPAATLDPFELMPFIGYIEPTTGRPERYLSLAHFYYAERLAGVDEHYRRYLLNLDDLELFRLEVDGVGLICGSRTNWETMQLRVLYAGIYMQALCNRAEYGELLSHASQLSVADCAFSEVAAAAMGQFIEDIPESQDRLKVVFLGTPQDHKFLDSCLSVLFARKQAQCLLAVEDDGCAGGVSMYAQAEATPFSLLSTSLSEEAIAENIMRRCTHVFRFISDTESPVIAGVIRLLEGAGVSITPIHAKK